jgi:chromosome segregation ATPase
LRGAAGSIRYRDFASAFKAFNDRQSDLDAALKEAAKLGTQVKQIRLDAEQNSGIIIEVRGEVERLQKVIEKDRLTITEYTNEAGQKVESARALAEQAEDLEATIGAYNQTFKQFQAQLDTRNAQFTEVSTALSVLSGDLTTKKAEIERL